MGRHRKDLIDKSTSLIIRFDNKTLFKLCDRFNISYDKSAEIIDNDVKKRLNVEMKKIISNYVK